MTSPTSSRDPDAMLAAWLEEGPTQLPENTRRAIAVGLRSTRQTRRVLDAPWRPNVRLAAAAVVAALAFAGALYLLEPNPPAIGGPTPAPTLQAPATSSASLSPAEDGSGNARYEITGPDAASGEAAFASSTVNAASDAYSQSVVFEDGSVVIRIKFPHPGCPASPIANISCGTVEISTATGNLRDTGWRASPLPAGPSCTWTIESMSANGGAGTIDCTNAVNPTHPDSPNRVTITFTYRDPSV